MMVFVSVPDRPGRPVVGPVACRPGQMRPFDFRNCAGQPTISQPGLQLWVTGRTVGFLTLVHE